MKLNEVKCSRSTMWMIPKTVDEDEDRYEYEEVEISCDSYEIDFERPLYKDRECDEAIIYAACESCGHRFEVHGHVMVDKVEG